MCDERQAILVTGTDTGAGKTFFTLRLITALRAKGIDVFPYKPVETGCGLSDDGALIPLDGLALAQAAELEDFLEEVCPQRFLRPAAPEVAALAENRLISLSMIKDDIARLRAQHQCLIIEGAGGALVPLVGHFSYADLAAECNLAVIVVVASRLGALNHACLTFEALRSRGVRLLGYVYNDLNGESEDEFEQTALQTNRQMLSSLAARYEIGELAFLPANSSLMPDLSAVLSVVQPGNS